MSDGMTPTPETTGHEAVDRVLDGLARIPDLPLDEHLDEYERAHTALQSALDGSEQDHASALRRVAEGSGPANDAGGPDAEAGGPTGERA